MTTANDLNAEIDRVFPRSSPPVDVIRGGGNEHFLADPPGSDEGCAVRSFWKKGWWEITPENLNSGRSRYECSVGFLSLTQEAFRYYLPTLLRLVLTDLADEKIGWGEWIESLCWQLDPEPTKLWGDYFEKIYGPMTLEQKQFVARVVKYIKTSFADSRFQLITPTCEAYWEQFDV